MNKYLSRMNKYLIVFLLAFILFGITIKSSFSEDSSTCDCLQYSDTDVCSECCKINFAKCTRYCLENFEEGEDRKLCSSTCKEEGKSCINACNLQ